MGNYGIELNGSESYIQELETQTRTQDIEFQAQLEIRES